MCHYNGIHVKANINYLTITAAAYKNKDVLSYSIM